MRQHQLFGYLGTVSVALAMPADARAEPGASMAHLPFLWIVAIGISAGLAWLAARAIGRTGRLQTPLGKWTLVVILTLILLVFVSPVIVGMGSILITGRTM